MAWFNYNFIGNLFPNLKRKQNEESGTNCFELGIKTKFQPKTNGIDVNNWANGIVFKCC